MCPTTSPYYGSRFIEQIGDVSANVPAGTTRPETAISRAGCGVAVL